jgi:putative ABC transport system permease protein
MFKNYFTVALRNLKKQKFYSFINIAGLSIGIACCILILLFVQDELSFDTFHTQSGSIYRILTEFDSDGQRVLIAPTALPLAPVLRIDIPEVTTIARISCKFSYLIGREDTCFYEDIIYADPDFLKIFSFPLLAGNTESVLSDPNSIVISEKMALKYFGDSDPVGRILTIQNTQDYTVTGVLRNLPRNSHLSFDFLASFAAIDNTPRATEWDHFSNDYTYLLLPDNAGPAALEEKFTAAVKKHLPADDADDYSFQLQPLKDIHFSSLRADVARTSEKSYIYIYAAIGIFILLIACINFMNLSTARSSRRAKEVGLRKVVGARRSQLIRQFFTESISTAFLSLFLASVIVELFLSRINTFIRKDLTFDPFGDAGLLAGLLGLTLLVGIVAGSHPALYLSSFQPAGILKKTPLYKSNKLSFRTVTVVFQFTISILLFVGTMTVYNQLNFMNNKELGFRADQVLVFPIEGSPIGDNPETFKTDILKNPSVVAATASSGTPASGRGIRMSFLPEGLDEGNEKDLKVIFTDIDFLETYGLTLAAGRDFSRTISTDASQAVIINETAVKELNWESPLGKTFKGDQDELLTVVGVVKDFFYDSMRSRIEPTLISLHRPGRDFISVRIHPENTASALAFLEKTWKRYAPRNPIASFFIDEEFESWYSFERRLGTIFTVCAVLAVFISCLGILGLASFAAEQRSKEIGIRKILGASVSGVVGLLSKEFLKLIVIANLIAWPVSYFLMSRWLSTFPYRGRMGIWMFALSASIALVVTLLTVSFQSIKAALANPVDSLHYE